MKKVLLAIVCVALAWCANAQFTLGVGYMGENEVLKSKNYSAINNDTTTKFDGFYVHAGYNLRIVKGFGVQPEVRLSFGNDNYSTTWAGVKYEYNRNKLNLDIPVMFTYCFELPHDLYLTLHLGPTFDLGLMDNITNTVGKTDKTVSNYDDDGTGVYLNKFDLLAETGVSFRYKHWGVEIRYAWGLLNMVHLPAGVSSDDISVKYDKLMVGASFAF